MDTCGLHVRKFQSRTRPGPSSGAGGRVSLPPRFHAVTPRPVRTQVLPFPALCLLPGSGEALVPLLGWSAPRPSGAQPRSELADAPLRRHPVSGERAGPAAGDASQRQGRPPLVRGPHSVPFLFEAHTPGRLQSSADHPVFKQRRQGQERDAPAEGRRRARGMDAPASGGGGLRGGSFRKSDASGMRVRSPWTVRSTTFPCNRQMTNSNA